MPPINANYILGSTCVIGSSTLWWISYHRRQLKPPQLGPGKQHIVRDTPAFSSKSIDQSIRRGGW